MSKVDWGEVAKAAARASTCRKRKVGAVIIYHKLIDVGQAYDVEDVLIGIGCNGPPRAALCDWIDTDGKDVSCLHAEWNAIVNATGSLYGATLYITRPPCERMCRAKIERFHMKVVVVD